VNCWEVTPRRAFSGIGTIALNSIRDGEFVAALNQAIACVVAEYMRLRKNVDAAEGLLSVERSRSAASASARAT
jgi:hypothetical protein